MLNNLMIVGRLINEPKIVETEDNRKKVNITVAVSRSMKNKDGIYESDFIDCSLYGNVGETTYNLCHKGDIVGIRGRLETRIKEDKKILEVVADKISFLKTKSQPNKDYER